MYRSLRAAVFDVDGMLLDTGEFIYQAYEHTLETHSLEIPSREVIARQIGRSLPDCYDALAPNGDFPVLAKTHHDFQMENFHLVKPYDGAVEVLTVLDENNIALAAFSSRKGNLIATLEISGLLDFFRAIVQGDEVTEPKPSPEGLLLALQRISERPSDAAMLGDAAVDIEAGKAAKVAITVGITHGFGTEAELIEAKPDYIVHHLREIPSILLDQH